MTEILMPALSDSMEQGLLLQWLVADGAEVQVGDELCEIETDKATMAYQSEIAGTLHILVPEGTTVAVGDPIATIGAAAPATTASLGASGVDTTLQAPKVLPINGGAGVREGAVATPVARRLAAEHGVELSALLGSGPRGRITKADVLGAAGIAAPAPASAPRREPEPAREPPPTPAPASNGAGRTEELTRLQQVVARRMAEAKSTIPHFQVQTEVVFDAAIALRAQLKVAAASLDEPAPSLNDLIVKASAIALRKHPHANGSYKDGRFELHDRVNVGVAVAAEGALVVPTVFDADTKALTKIAADTRALAERVRTGQITPPELSGATFTVSNLGMFGMTAITPVINPPQAATLGVGAARAVLQRDAESGEIVDRQLLTLTLSCDHRILYGADAARFLAEIKALLEKPLRLAF
ncbi:MAG: dihydrolipoamide acetyltransferase family protein [Solirubrobacteraceae bacterium]